MLSQHLRCGSTPALRSREAAPPLTRAYKNFVRGKALPSQIRNNPLLIMRMRPKAGPKLPWMEQCSGNLGERTHDNHAHRISRSIVVSRFSRYPQLVSLGKFD